MHEPVDGGLRAVPALVAAVTSVVAVREAPRYLAVWSLTVDIHETGASVWTEISRRTGPGRGRLYVPAFSLARAVVERLGVRLTRLQPALRPGSGGVGAGGIAPAHVSASAHAPTRVGAEPEGPAGPGIAAGGGDLLAGGGFASRYSPVLLGRQDARVLSHFVYLALRAGQSREVPTLDYELEVLAEELVYLPAVPDARCVHDANWRLLLREFDDQVA